MRTLQERFWEKVTKIPGGCWEFQSLDPRGYGQISSGPRGGTMLKAHRVSWEIANGQKIPPGLCVMHTCDNPACVNPEHLRVGTKGDNNRDMFAKGRAAVQIGTQNLPVGDAHWARRNPDLVSRGEKNGRAKMTEARVRVIREEAKAGVPQRKLARLFGVTQAAISLIVKRTNWAHVGE